MDLKKIMELAMLALMVIPSLTVTVGAVEEEDMACAIERAQIYLDKVRASAKKTASLYPEGHMIYGYLNEIYELLGTEILLQTTGDVGAGNESRIVIPMPDGFTLGDLETLSWSVNTTYGYPPHVDVFLATTDPLQSVLTAELAVNNPSYSPPTYGTYNTWLETFEMASADGYDEIDDTTVLWVTKMGAGDLDAPSSTLANWKLGTIDNDPGSELLTTEISSATLVLKLEIEVDNWIAQTKAYVDDIEINGVTKRTAKYYLDQALAYHDAGDNKSAARCLASARNILGRVKGLLNSMAKAHKVTRTERFMDQVRHRIEGIVDKVERLRGRLGEGIVNKVKASMGHAWGNIPQLGDDPSDEDVNAAIDNLEITIASINADLVTLGVDISDTNILEAMDRLEAKIRVLDATANRLSRKGCDTTAVVDELVEAGILLNGMMDSLVDGDTENADDLLQDAGDIVSEASKNIRGFRNQDKGSKGKGKGQER